MGVFIFLEGVLVGWNRGGVLVRMCCAGGRGVGS